MSASLGVVMPIHNEAPHLPATVESLVEALGRSGFAVEIVVVDDGSTDGSAEVFREALAERIPLTVLGEPNRGRFAARLAGLRALDTEYVLLLDGRVRIDPDALAFVEPQIEAGAEVWASHVHVIDRGNPLGVFMRLLAELAWSDYFDDPRTTSFGVADFDRYPKGTGCLLAPRTLLLEAMESFVTAYADMRHANDDTALLRWVAQRTRIHVSPHYSSSYAPRTELAPFVRHAYHRGIVFVDGHGRRQSRFFPVVVGFYPASALWLVGALRRASLVPATILAVGAASALFAVSRGRTRHEAISLALSTPVYAAAHGAGMWRGLSLVVRGLARRPR